MSKKAIRPFRFDRAAALALIAWAALCAAPARAEEAPSTDIRGQYADAVRLVQEERNEEARHALLKIIEAEPRFAPAYFSLGVVRLKEGEMGEAVDYFKKSIRNGGKDGMIHYLLASALVRLDRLDEARESYLEAIARKPGLANAHHDLGVLYYRTGDFGRAAESLQKALELEPKSVKTMLMLGVADIRDGHPEKAIEMVTALRNAGDETKAVHLENLLRESQAKRNIPEPDPTQLSPGAVPAARPAAPAASAQATLQGKASAAPSGTPQKLGKTAPRKKKSPFAR